MIVGCMDIARTMPPQNFYVGHASLDYLYPQEKASYPPRSHPRRQRHKLARNVDFLIPRSFPSATAVVLLLVPHHRTLSMKISIRTALIPRIFSLAGPPHMPHLLSISVCLLLLDHNDSLLRLIASYRLLYLRSNSTKAAFLCHQSAMTNIIPMR
jgi:hypothetical protein